MAPRVFRNYYNEETFSCLIASIPLFCIETEIKQTVIEPILKTNYQVLITCTSYLACTLSHEAAVRMATTVFWQVGRKKSLRRLHPFSLQYLY